MKTLTITRDQYQDLEDAYNDAMSDRNVLLLRSIKVELDEMIDDAHTEALAEWLERLDSDVSPEDKAAEARQTWFYAANGITARRALVIKAHVEALEINAEFDIAGVNAARLQSQFYAAYDYSRRREIVEAAHSEALGINQCFDFNVQQSELAAEQQRAVLERLA